MKIFTWKIVAMPRHKKGPPRRRGSPKHGYAHLGKPGGSKDKLPGPHRRGIAHLGGGRLCLGELEDEILTCHGQVGVGFGARFVNVWGVFRDPACDVCGLLRRPCETCLEVSLLE